MTVTAAPVPPTATPPRRAMVLAAGLGLRMRPLTLNTPKPLIPVMGRTLLDRALDHLERAAVDTAVVNTHYKAEMIAAHLAGRTTPPAIVLSPEETALETGGGVKNALPHLGADPFLVVNADILWLDGPQPAIQRLAAHWNPETMDALLLLMSTTRAVGYEGVGDFQMDPEGTLSRREESRVAPFVYAGVQIVKPELFAESPDGAFSMNVLWDRAIAAGRLRGIAHDGLWYHVGTPSALQETEELLAMDGLKPFWP
ncbi:MurNAc alpha-1-phosphate uridylyltransferase [Azospirillum fermentarium]|uniref:nucleotidyltransferase family protein n=1 Tax=Azospirillum fermentarium TaxID=1233114 RepID=UPI002226F0B3|nr:nucleotidyltransferase family protein [Azospirillum fermentarium]MCW2244827.1 MurNAc alpha-1-phosphate uridylyltransferase [Azospirillum fermentarium]